MSSRTEGSTAYRLLVPAAGGILPYATPFDSHDLDARRESVPHRVDGRGAVLTDSLPVVPDREVLVTRGPRYRHSLGSRVPGWPPESIRIADSHLSVRRNGRVRFAANPTGGVP